jgi:hypothetical protein
MPGLVPQRDSVSLDGLALGYRDRGWRKRAGQVLIVAVGFSEKVVVVNSPDDVLPKISGDAFGAIVPEHDLSLAID